MSRGPGIREIFSSKSLTKAGGFQFEKQESMQQLKLSKNKDHEPSSSPMKKFGGYKPKILAGEDNFLEIQTNPIPDAEATILAGNHLPTPDQFQEPLSHRHQPITTTNKPWVIGDKNIPMVLGSINDNEDDEDDNNNNTNNQITDAQIHHNSTHKDNFNSQHLSDSHRPLSISSETSTLVRQYSEEFRQGIDNPVLYSNGDISLDNQDLSSLAPEAKTTFDSYTSNRDILHGDINNELPGVFIPAPDYDEDEKTLDFNSEDTDDPSDGGDDGKPRQMKAKTAIKVYEGEDLSHYLREDEAEQEVVVLRNENRGRQTLGRSSKSEVIKSKTNQKQSLYNKQQSGTKSKRKSKGNSPLFSSVRSFSYADSKIGTRESNLGKSLSSPNLPDESEIFLSTNNQQSSYESFLKSRHADDLPYDLTNGGNNVEVRQNSKFKHNESDPMWKKLTLRLKRRISKSMGGKEQ